MKRLPLLSFPIAKLKVVKTDSGDLKVYDRLRKKFVSLTPEEWIRQNFVDWLINEKSYPESRIGNEIEINLNETRKRCDTLVYGIDFQPLMLVEYKAPDVEITQNTFDQIVRYNMKLKAKYLVVTNGLKLYCCVIDYKNSSYNFIPRIPDFKEATLSVGEN